MKFQDLTGYLPQLVAALAATVGTISDGFSYGWASPIIPKLMEPDSPIKISHNDVDWLEMLYMIGGIAGLPITMYSVDKFGRQKSVIIAAANNLIAWILIGTSNSVIQLYVARFMAGLGSDVAFVSIPMYIAEMADRKIRGALTSIIFMTMLIGILLCYSIAPFVSIPISSAVPGTFAVIQLVSMIFVPESPYYLLLNKKEEQAEKALQWSRRKNDVSKELEEIKAAVERQSQERGGIKEVFVVASNRKALTIVMFLNLAQHFSSFSVMLMNLHVILADAEGIISPNMSAIIFAGVMLVFSIIGAPIFDKFGRKIMLLFSCLVCSTSLGGMALYLTLKHLSYDVLPYNWVPVVAVLIYSASFRLGMGSVPIILTGELFPTSVKSIGMTLGDCTYVCSGTLAIYLYHVIESSYGIYLAFWVFSGSCMLAAIFTLVYVPETKGKTLEQIQMMLKGTETKKDENVT